MNHGIVYRCTDACGKRPSIGIGEVLERWNGSIVADELLRNFIQLEGRYTWFDMFSQFAKGLANKLVGPAHQLNLIFCFQKDLHQRRLVCLNAALTG